MRESRYVISFFQNGEIKHPVGKEAEFAKHFQAEDGYRAIIWLAHLEDSVEKIVKSDNKDAVHKEVNLLIGYASEIFFGPCLIFERLKKSGKL